MLRKVGVNSDNVPLLSFQVARRQGNRFEALDDSSAAPDPASLSADQGRHAEPFDASPQRVHAQFDLTEGDSDRSTVQEEGNSTESDTESCGVVGRPVRRLRLMWSQDQHEVPSSVDSHDQRLARVRQQLMQDGVRGQCQGMDREVRAAESLFGNSAQRVGAVPQGAPVPPAIRRQRWSPVMVPLLWSAAGEEQTTPMVEWLVTTASTIPVPVQFHGGQDLASESVRTGWAALRAVLRSWGIQSPEQVEPVVEESRISCRSTRTPHFGQGARILVP